jgi:FkbH-like protein
MRFGSKPDRLSRSVSVAINQQMPRLAELFARSTELLPRWAATAASESQDRSEYVQREFGVLPIYLREFFRTGDDGFLALLVGERLKAFYDPSLPDEERRDIVARICLNEREQIKSCFEDSLSPAAEALLSQSMERIHRQLLPQNGPATRIIFLGDCLFLDIGGFIVSPLLELGIAIEIEYVTARTVAELSLRLRSLAQQKTTLVFYSPLTYEFNSDYQALLSWRNASMPAGEAENLALLLSKQTAGFLDVLSGELDCPVYVHNLSGLIREERPLLRIAKQRLTKRNRNRAGRLFNHLLRENLDRLNSSQFKRFHVLDENEVVSRSGEFAAGAYFHHADLQHPAVLGRLLAPAYVDIIFVHSRLMGRKLLVCDLDNTLWNGVIGEGEVQHFHDRQQILKRLRERGVLLAILSKNDPARVHWRGSTLTEHDFVHSVINWDPKVQGMKRTQAALNLKTKDFVFIDDRSDERELMKESFPEVLTLDASDAAVWARLALWADALDDEPGMDRTLMYRQREERTQFTGQEEGEAAVDAQLFAKLQLTLEISTASQNDLKRAVELINRTNQFNLEGTRTSLREATAWHTSGQHVILLGRTADRFGDMGITSVAVMSIAEQRASLLAFVLSCRVFGYGIDRAMLNQLKRVAQSRHVTQLEGRYKATAQNAPCRNFLPDNSFIEVDGAWICDLGHDIPADAEWLRVTAK